MMMLTEGAHYISDSCESCVLFTRIILENCYVMWNMLDVSDKV